VIVMIYRGVEARSYIVILDSRWKYVFGFKRLSSQCIGDCGRVNPRVFLVEVKQICELGRLPATQETMVS